LLPARRTQQLIEMARELGQRVLPLTLDVTDCQAIAQISSSLPADWAEVDLLVNNAGLALGLEGAHRAELRDWETMVEVNVLGLVRCVHALLPGMVARNRGHIVNIGSIAAQMAYPGGNVYGASKAFVRQFTLGLKADLIATPVRCTAIEPGMVSDTEFSSVRFKGDASRVNAIYKGTNALQAIDVAQAVVWVAAQPAHVNVTLLQLMPVCQGPGPTLIHRTT
jgi:3-hydroxy acid dehydrogenase/malonic semialdehyde reductase